MKILYQSDVTGKTYESKQALIEAEEKVSKEKKAEEIKKQERAKEAKIVQAKLEEAAKLQKEAREALTAFCEKYGTFKTTLKNDDFFFSPFSIFSDFFKF